MSEKRERRLSVLTLFLLIVDYPVLLVFYFAGLLKAPSLWKKYLWMGVFVLAFFAFNYEALGNSDLVRYYAQLDNIKECSFAEAITWQNSHLYVRNIIFWIAAKTNCYGLLPALAISSVFGVGNYITCDTASRYGKEDQIIYLLVLQFFLFPFFSIVNNVRNVTAFALILLAFYRDIVQKNRNLLTGLLYLLPCFIHSGGWTLIALRLAVYIARRFMLASLLFLLIPTALIQIAYKNASIFVGIPSIHTIILKAHMYSSEEYSNTEYAIQVAHSSWQKLVFLVLMSIAVLIIVKIIHSAGIKSMFSSRLLFQDNDLVVSSFLLSILILSCNVFSAPHYWRYAVALGILIGNTMICVKDSSRTITKLLDYGVWGLAVAHFVLQVYHNRLYFFEIDWLYRIFLHGPLYLLYNCINAIFL